MVTRKMLKMYKQNVKEAESLNRQLERLYERMENIPVVSGKVQASSDDFPYTPIRVSVQMDEPRESDSINRRIKEKEDRLERIEKDINEVETYITGLPEGREKDIAQAYYIDNKTARETGELIGYSHTRVLQILKDFPHFPK